MQYTFEISTTQGIITAEVNTERDFIDAPFLIKGFRSTSSSTCDTATLDEFWNIVETALNEHEINMNEFIEVLRAYKNGELLGECDNY